MQSYLKHYIDGAWVESEGGRRHEVIDPSTEQPCTEITLGTAADVDKAVAAAKKAFASWSQTSIEERAAILEKVIAGMKARLPELAAATSREMGAPISFAQMAQVPAGLGHFMGTLAALREFKFSEQVGNSRVVHEPVGVVAMITPWNWPLNQICAKVAPALAAGNTMILKPSEEAPSNALILAEILHDAGVPGRPAISTRQRRQEPKASTESVAQSLGTWMPASTAARMIEVPAATVTAKPSIVRLTCSARPLAGVP